jgi:hypothetical protein
MSIPAGYRLTEKGWYYKTEEGEGPFFVSAAGEAHQGLEPRYMTDGNGPYARLRVDVGQTGFFAGREAFIFHEFSIASGASRVIKVVAPCDTIVQTFAVELDLAAIRVELVVGGTEGGTFSSSIPVFKTNNMSTASAYTPQITMAYGGTHTGGTVVDVLTAVSGSNANKAVAASATEEKPVGFAAGTYYIRLINTDGATASGIFRARWEERPATP